MSRPRRGSASRCALAALWRRLRRRSPRRRARSHRSRQGQGEAAADRQAQARHPQGRPHRRASPAALIVQSKAAPYLPDLFFRLAELYVEKSRYMYVLQAEESNSSSDKGSIIAPEVRLLKEKALQLYNRILNEFPDYRDNDKVLFFIGPRGPRARQVPGDAQDLPGAGRQAPQELAGAKRPSTSWATTGSTSRTHQGRELLPAAPGQAARHRRASWPTTSWASSASSQRTSRRPSSTSRPA